MKLNSFLLLSAAVVASASLASCDSSGNNDMTVSYGVPSLNLVTDATANIAEIDVTNYALGFNYTQSTVSVTLQESSFNGNNVRFALQNIPFKFSQYDGRYTFNYTAAFEGGGTNSVSNLSGIVAEMNTPPLTGTGSVQFDSNLALILGYTVNRTMQVRTFPSHAVYTGQTEANDGANVFKSNQTLYRVRINPAQKTATVYFYKAKFSDKMPMTIDFFIDGLTLTPSARGTYTISGTNIIPVTADGSKFPNYIFKEFTLTTLSADLTSVKIDYKVGEKYSGSFMGSYLVSSNNGIIEKPGK